MSLPDLWFGLVAFFWIGYFVLEGFDFGVGMLLPLIGRSEDDRSQMLETIGPVWDANEVWLIVAGGATFAAFPVWYATLFSGAYVWLVLALLALILRAISFEWGGKSDHRHWGRFWMWANAAGGLLIPLLFGVALSALLKGVPINDQQDFSGSPMDFLSWYSLLAGVAVVGICLVHGAVFLSIRTSGEVRERATVLARRVAPVSALLAIAFVVATLAVAHDTNQASLFPAVVPAALAVIAAVDVVVFTRIGRQGWAFVATAATMGLAILTLFFSLYPRVMVSSSTFANSLTVDNASSAHYTLHVMTVAAAVLTPVVLGYQIWTYWVFRKRLTAPPVPATPAG